MTPGTPIRRLRWTRPDGTTAESLYEADTAAWHMMDDLRAQGIDVRTDRVRWDGKAYVSGGNGD